MYLGKAIKSFRIARGFSQAKLAECVGISTSYLSLLERDKRDPTFSIVLCIAQELDVSVILLAYLASTDAEMGVLDTGIQEKISQVVLSELKRSP